MVGIKNKSGRKEGFKHTEETKIKISESKRGIPINHDKQFKKGMIPWNKGKKLSEKHVENLSKSHKNYNMPENQRKKISEKLKLMHKEGKIKTQKGKIGDMANNWQGGKCLNKICLDCGGEINHRSERCKKCDIKYRIGENHQNWLGGISFEPYNKNWTSKFKRAIRKRDNQICMLCGIHREKLKKAFAIHHINYDKLLSIPQNCISLCNSCHMKTNFNRKHWIGLFQSLLSEKYQYQYNEMEILLDG